MDEQIRPWIYQKQWKKLGEHLIVMLYTRPHEQTGTVEFRYSSGIEHLYYEIQIYGLETTLGKGAIYTISFQPQEMSEGGDFELLNPEQKYIVTESRQFWDTYKKETK